MYPKHSPVRAMVARAFQIPFCAASIPTAVPCPAGLKSRIFSPSSPTPASSTQLSQFSSTPPQLARDKKKAPKKDRRITMIRYHLYHPTTLIPRPLRLSRNRSLRHWTIHRAWQLFSNSRKRERQTALQRQQDAMRDACEELRVGAGDGGRLFRKAMMKTGLWGLGPGKAIPIEYARGMMDWVGTVDGLGNKVKIWDEAWKR